MVSTLLDEAKTTVGCSAVLKLIENDRTTKERKLLSTPAPIYLQIEFSKIPKITRRTIRIPLKNSLLSENSDVCLILADVIRGRNVNHELTINRFKKIMEKKGISRKLHLMTSRQIRVEFTTFEAKRKLSKMFDVFLIDEKISEYVRSKLGKEFPKARKWPIPIRMKAKNLNNEIESKLMKSSLALDGSGNNKTIQIGHIDMTPKQLAENVLCVANYIEDNFPSGWDNIRTLHLKGMRSQSIPIYMSLISKNLISEPKIIGKSRHTIIACNELSTNGEKVRIYRSGKIKVLKRKNVQRNESDCETEDDVSDEKKLKLDNSVRDQQIDAESSGYESSSTNKSEKKKKSTKKSKKDVSEGVESDNEIDIENMESDIEDFEMDDVGVEAENDEESDDIDEEKRLKKILVNKSESSKIDSEKTEREFNMSKKSKTLKNANKSSKNDSTENKITKKDAVISKILGSDSKSSKVDSKKIEKDIEIPKKSKTLENVNKPKIVSMEKKRTEKTVEKSTKSNTLDNMDKSSKIDSEKNKKTNESVYIPKKSKTDGKSAESTKYKLESDDDVSVQFSNVDKPLKQNNATKNNAGDVALKKMKKIKSCTLNEKVDNTVEISKKQNRKETTKTTVNTDSKNKEQLDVPDKIMKRSKKSVDNKSEISNDTDYYVNLKMKLFALKKSYSKMEDANSVKTLKKIQKLKSLIREYKANNSSEKKLSKKMKLKTVSKNDNELKKSTKKLKKAV